MIIEESFVPEMKDSIADEHEEFYNFSTDEEVYEETYEDETREELSSAANIESLSSIKVNLPKSNENLLKVPNEDDEKLFTFICHKCDVAEFDKMYQLSSHTRSKHNCLPQVKCFCDKFISTSKGLMRHRAKHFPKPTDLRCSACNKLFKTHEWLKKHFEKFHGNNKQRFICSREFCIPICF